jgi:hypothetical protein
MRGPLRILTLLARIVLGFLRDAAYRLMSRHRGRLFGRTAECRFWDNNWDMRFVNDADFGGRGNNDDPIADPSLAAAASPDDEAASPPVRAGDHVRVVSPAPILHTHVDGHGGGGRASQKPKMDLKYSNASNRTIYCF